MPCIPPIFLQLQHYTIILYLYQASENSIQTRPVTAHKITFETLPDLTILQHLIKKKSEYIFKQS